MARLLINLALAGLLAQLLCGCGGQAPAPVVPQRPDIDSASSARLGGQDAPGDPEGVSSFSL